MLMTWYLCHTHQDMQENADRLTTFASQVRLRVNTTKTEVMALNPTPIKLGDDDIKYVDHFTYLGSVLTTARGADQDIHNPLGKAGLPSDPQTEYRDHPSIYTKTKLYKSCVVPVLLYGAECWKMTDTDIKKSTLSTQKNSVKYLRCSGPQKFKIMSYWKSVKANTYLK